MLQDSLPAPHPVRSGGTVLVIDDEETVREVANRALRHYGYDVLLAENGQRGIEVFQAHPEVVAIVLDMAMPVMSGDKAAPHLRKMNPAVPIILSSGYSETDARRRFEAVGATLFLQKPYSIAALIDAVSRSVVADAPSDRFTTEDRG
jgi:CheY-like chemotaxis protein